LQLSMTAPALPQSRANGGAILVVVLDEEGGREALAQAARSGRGTTVTVLGPARALPWFVLACAGGVPVHPVELELACAQRLAALARQSGLPSARPVCSTEPLRDVLPALLRERDYAEVLIGCRRRDRRARTLLALASAWCPVELVDRV
jgi:hypothetical protein